MYVIFLQCTHCVKKTLTVSCTLLCESGDRVKVDQSSFSADLHGVMLCHHCSKYVTSSLLGVCYVITARSMLSHHCSEYATL